MSPELQALVSTLDEGATAGTVRWTTRKSRFQTAMREAAVQIRKMSSELEARKASEMTPLRVRAFSKVR